MDYLTIALTPLLLAAAGLLIIRFRRLSWRDDVGFRQPRLVDLVFWCAIFVIFVALAELAGNGAAAGSWRGKYSAADLAIRIVAVALVYPIAEEFFFRGVFLGVVRRRLGDVVAVILPAILFGLIHVQYDWRGMVFVAVDGLLFGLCRVRTGSVYVAMLLHILGNTYAVWERLA